MDGRTITGAPLHAAVPRLAEAARRGRLSRREFVALACALGTTSAAAHGLIGLAVPALAQDAPHAGGILRISMPVMEIADPRIFDWPQKGNLARMFCEPLVRCMPDSSFAPWLLESWEVNDNATAYRLNLRQDVSWNNGDPFTAEDVIFNLSRWCESHVPGNSMATRLGGLVVPRGEADVVETIRAEDGSVREETRRRPVFGPRDDAIRRIDDHTVEIALPAPDVTLIPAFSDYPALIVHRGFAGDLAAAPVGTGAWQLQEFAAGSHAHFRRRASGGPWWGDAVLGPVPLDGVDFVDLGVDPSAELDAFEQGAIETSYETPPTFVEDADRLGLVRSETLTANTLCVRMNLSHPPFDDQRLRSAVQLGVDNAVVLDLGYQGYGKPAENHHVGPMNPDYAALPPIRHDPDRARALLAESGHGDTELELVSLDDEVNRNTCDAVAAQLRDTGFQVRRTVLAASVFWRNWQHYPFSCTEWTMRPLGVQVYALAYRSGAPWNETGFADPEFDRLLDAALAIPDPAARVPVMAQLQAILQGSGVLVQPFWRSIFRHMSPRLHGLVMHPAFELQLEQAWLDA